MINEAIKRIINKINVIMLNILEKELLKKNF